MASTKYKTFKLLEILYQETDKNHRLKTNELIEKLAEIGISCDRRSIYDDIELFQELGIDVKKDVGYYIEHRQFTLEEVKILTDALSSAEFLPVVVTDQIKDKLRGTLSVTEADIIEKQFFANYSKDHFLNNGETVMSIIRELVLAIHNSYCVTITTKNNKKHQVSPYSLVFYNQKYYLIGYNYRPGKIFHFRIDNIIAVKKSNYSYIPVNEVSDYEDALDTAEYMTKTFKMFAGKEETVVMRIHNDILQYIIMYFPELDFKPMGEKYFRGKTTVNVSDGFYNFILGYGEQIQVLEPKEVADEVKRRALKIANMYE